MTVNKTLKNIDALYVFGEFIYLFKFGDQGHSLSQKMLECVEKINFKLKQ